MNMFIRDFETKQNKMWKKIKHMLLSLIMVEPPEFKEEPEPTFERECATVSSGDYRVKNKKIKISDPYNYTNEVAYVNKPFVYCYDNTFYNCIIKIIETPNMLYSTKTTVIADIELPNKWKYTFEDSAIGEYQIYQQLGNSKLITVKNVKTIIEAGINEYKQLMDSELLCKTK